MTYCAIMFGLGLCLGRFAFVRPQVRKGLEDILFICGVLAALIFCMFRALAIAGDPWTLYAIIRLGAIIVSSMAPYLGYVTGNYFGFKYEGK